MRRKTKESRAHEQLTLPLVNTAGRSHRRLHCRRPVCRVFSQGASRRCTLSIFSTHSESLKKIRAQDQYPHVQQGRRQCKSKRGGGGGRGGGDKVLVLVFVVAFVVVVVVVVVAAAAVVVDPVLLELTGAR